MAATVCSPKPFINCCRKTFPTELTPDWTAGGSPNRRPLFKGSLPRGAPGKRKTERGVSAHGINDDENSHGSLGNGCGGGSACRAESQNRYEYPDPARC